MTVQRLSRAMFACTAAGLALGLAGCVQEASRPSSPGASSSGVTGSGPDAVLAAHNAYRARHGAAALTWSAPLAANAQGWADTCNFEHSGVANAGENLAAWSGGGRSAVDMVDRWYAENTDYDYVAGRSANGAPIGHFTQMVWKGSTELGCGVSQCPALGSYLVCQYAPQGNILGQFTQNVSPPL